MTPAFVLVTGAFYTQDEQVNRIAFWVRHFLLRNLACLPDGTRMLSSALPPSVKLSAAFSPT